MSNLFQNTLKHLEELNRETPNRDIAAVTFDAMQLLKEQKARIAEFESLSRALLATSKFNENFPKVLDKLEELLEQGE